MAGKSMLPTYQNEDVLITDTNTTTINRGDVIIYSITTPDGNKGYLVKRIVGLPNESIEIKEGQIFSNKTAIKIPQIRLVKSFGTENPDNSEPIDLASDQYYVLGDNTSESSDSRLTGPVNSYQIEAIVTGKH